MIALDTNVLIRYIVQDDLAQARKATRLIESLTPEKPAFISDIVLCEINWVLKAAYKIAKAERISVLYKICGVNAFEFENTARCLKAVQRYETGKADFSDYLIAGQAITQGCKYVVTFDKNALTYADFKAL